MWAVLNTQEGGRYGVVVSRHETWDAADAALRSVVKRECPRRAIARLMWTIAEVPGAAGERVRYRE